MPVNRRLPGRQGRFLLAWGVKLARVGSYPWQPPLGRCTLPVALGVVPVALLPQATREAAIRGVCRRKLAPFSEGLAMTRLFCLALVATLASGFDTPAPQQDAPKKGPP